MFDTLLCIEIRVAQNEWCRGSRPNFTLLTPPPPP